MPAALDVDWEQVRMLAMDVGLLAAADMLGISYDAVRQRSCREQWVASVPRNQPLPPTIRQPVTLVTSPVNAQQMAMKEDALHGRAAQLRVGRKTLERLSETPVEQLLTPEMSTVAKNYGTLHAQAAGYAASDSIAKVNLSITGHAVMEAEIVQQADAQELP